MGSPQSFPTLLFCYHSLFCRRRFSALFLILKIKSSKKMERVKDLCSGSGALWLWKLSGRLENQPHLICMTDSKRVLNIACPLFQVNTSATGFSRKWHPSEIGCKNKIVKSEENKKRNIPMEIPQVHLWETLSLLQQVCLRPRPCNIHLGFKLKNKIKGIILRCQILNTNWSVISHELETVFFQR